MEFDAEHRAWLTALQSRIENKPIQVEELKKLFALIEDACLMTNLYCSGMFGGVGLGIYEHEVFMGTGPSLVFRLPEQCCPEGEDLRAIMWGGTFEREPHVPGSFRKDAWEVFTKVVTSQKNLDWLKYYRMRLDLNHSRYEY